LKGKVIIIGSILLAAALAGMGIYYYYQYQIDLLQNHLDYRIKSFKPTQISAKEAKIEFTFLIENKSTLQAKVLLLYLEVYVNNEKVGIIENKTFKGIDQVERDYFVIVAKGISEVHLETTILPPVILSEALHTLITYLNGSDISFKLSGYAKVEVDLGIKGTIPFSYETSLKEMMAPKTLNI